MTAAWPSLGCPAKPTDYGRRVRVPKEFTRACHCGDHCLHPLWDNLCIKCWAAKTHDAFEKGELKSLKGLSREERIAVLRAAKLGDGS